MLMERIYDVPIATQNYEKVITSALINLLIRSSLIYVGNNVVRNWKDKAI